MKRLLLPVLFWLACTPLWAQQTLETTKIITPPATDLTIAPTSDVVLGPTGADVLPSANYSVNLGSFLKKYLTLHAAELWVQTLVAMDTMTTIGGRLFVASTTTFVQDVGTGDTTIHVKHNSMANGDRAYSEANAKVEFFAITSSASSHSGHYDYTVTRNLDGSGANDWYAGDALMNTGQTGNGFIDIYSLRGTKSMLAGTFTEAGPTMVGNVRTSSTYNAWEPRWAIGNLDGLYSYSGTTFGAAFGVPDGARALFDATNGIRIYGGDNDAKVTIDTSGNATFDGKLTVGTGRNMIRNSECRVSADDWTLSHNTGLSPTLSFNLSGSFSLLSQSSVCYITMTGTPANGTVSQADSEFIPAVPGQTYEASVYVGLHRALNAKVFIQFYDAVASVIAAPNVTICTASTPCGTGGTTLESYTRGGVIAVAPANTASMKMTVLMTHNGLGPGSGDNPYLFFVRMYLGEASSTQEDLTEWGPAGITEITNGLIKTDAINARTIAADSITTSELAANAVIAENITAGIITADKLNVSTLSAISADLGTVTAGSISGVTATFGSGGDVVLNSSGITLSAGSGSNDRIKWDVGGSYLQSLSDGQTTLNSGANLYLNSGGSTNIELQDDTDILGTLLVTSTVRLQTVSGSGATSFVCTDNDGDLYASANACGTPPAPAAAADVAELYQRIDALERHVAALLEALQRYKQ